MSALGQLQARFCAGLSPFSDRDRQALAAEQILPHGRLGNAVRLDIYRRNISGAHVSVLEQVFPVCREIIGERGFAVLGREYAWRSSGAGPDLNRYGADFPRFLDAGAVELPYLHDLAELEYRWHQALFAEDDSPFDFGAFATAAQRPDRLRFSTSHSLHLLHSDWPVLELWSRHRAGDAPRELDAGDEPDRLVIARAGLAVEITAVDRTLFGLLLAIARRTTLDELGRDPASQDALGRLPQLISRGWISGFTMGEGADGDR